MTHRTTFSSTQSSSFSFVLRQVAAVASVVLLLAAMAPQVATAQQDTASTDTAPRWTHTFEQQIQTLLESGNANMQARGMQLIVELGERDDYAFDFRSMRPQIYDVLLNRDNADNLRILALSALHATGPTPGNRILVASVQDETSPRVRRFMLRMLIAEKQNTY